MSQELPLDPNYELEQQFILRLPQDAAIQLSKDIDAGIAFKDIFSIEFKPDLRHTKIQYKGQLYFGKIVDLPCIVESLKTTDKKTFYKTADISQMMICSQENLEGPIKGTSAYLDLRSNKPIPNAQREIREFQYLHGITPPLKNVLRRRFRKTCRKRFVDMPKIEAEVKQQLRQDTQSESVLWEVIWSDPPKSTFLKDDQNKSQLNSGNMGGADDDLDEEDSRRFPIDRKGLFGGEISSSEEEDYDDSEDEGDKKSKNPETNTSSSQIFNSKTKPLKSKNDKFSNTGLNLSSSDGSDYPHDEQRHVPRSLNESSLDAMIPRDSPKHSPSENSNQFLDEDSQDLLSGNRFSEVQQSEQAIIEQNNQETAFSNNSMSRDMGGDFFDEDEFIEPKGGELLDTNEDALMEFPTMSGEMMDGVGMADAMDENRFFQLTDEDKLDLV